jgi:hypothetical protein
MVVSFRTDRFILCEGHPAPAELEAEWRTISFLVIEKKVL